MIIIKLIVFVFMLVVFPRLISQLKTPNFIKELKKVPVKTKFLIKRIYRLLNYKRTSHYVWKELIQYHKESGWNYGLFEQEKNIRCLFAINEQQSLNFSYTIKESSLNFNAIILHSFDEERTNDVMILASHFNNLLNYGVVRVNLSNNYIAYDCSVDLLLFSLYPSKIKSYSDMHYGLSLDCFWAFTKLIETGDDPVFIFSELMRNKENNDSTNN